MVVANAVIMLVAIAGNSMILIVFKSSKRMKNTTDILIANLAVSDLLFPILAIPRKIADLYMVENTFLIQGLLGVCLCKITNFATDVSTFVSILTIILITIDRFLAIVLPMRGYTVQQKTCIILVALTWVIGVCLFGVYLDKFRLYFYGSHQYPICTLVWADQRTGRRYFVVLSVLLAVVPLSLIVIFYTIIFLNLKRQQRRIGISLSDPQNVQRSLRQRKILYLSFAIVLSFVLCWAPFNVYAYVRFFSLYRVEDWCVIVGFGFCSHFLAQASAAVNPVITFLFSSKFRGASREIFRRWERKHYPMRTISTNLEMH